jgi:gliding motility-associated-like protein
MRALTVLLLSILLAGLADVYGSIYYVDVSGNDVTGNGSAALPWRTLRYAVTKTAANQGHIIRLSAGTFVETGQVAVPLGVSIEGVGKDVTILKAATAFYYYPADPDYATDRFLLSLDEYNPSNGNQHLTGFTVDGDQKKLHGGIIVRYRSNVTIDDVKVTSTNFTGIWLWDVKDSRITNTDLINCSWGSTGYCSGALNIGNLERVEIDHSYIDEDTGYGIKAIGPSGYNDILYTRIHDCTVTVTPFGKWNNGSAPNLAIELWMADPLYSEIYNCYIDNNVSLVNANNNPSTGNQTIRVHDNIIDLSTRAQGHGYGIELTMHDAEIDHNYFIKGDLGIANWDNPMKNWSIHHNVFYAIQGSYPGEIIRSQWSGLHNVKFYNNTIEFESDKTASVVGLYGGASDNLDFRNNLIINSNTGYNYYPNQFIHMEGGATLTGLTATNNLLYNLPIGSVPGTYSGNLTSDPKIRKGTVRPTPYYEALAGSPLIDGGTDTGLPFKGSKPDIGAYEFETVTTPNVAPVVSITSPANNATFANGASIAITATATDSDGTVSKVEFFNGSSKLGEDLSSPFTFTIASAQAGTYSITARASDNLSATTTSSPVTINVTSPANVPPTVTVTAPANNATFPAGSTVNVAATATDPDGTIARVEFFNGSTKLGEDITLPYTFSITNALAGSYSITARATDNSGASTTSQIIIFTVTSPTNALPSVTITAPANNASFTAGTAISITVNALDSDGTISKVEFFNGSSKLGEDTTSPYTFTITNAQAGPYSISAWATDNGGASATSQTITFTVSATVNALPSVAITAPANNASFTAGDAINIIATATDPDGSISNVEFFNGSTKLGEDATSPYAFSIVNAQAGVYNITARAIDNLNAIAISQVITFTVSSPSANQAPVVSITSPQANSSFVAGTPVTINVSAMDPDGTVSKIEVHSGSTKLGETTTSPYIVSIGSPSPGAYSITATAYDNQNLSSVSAPVSVRIVAVNAPPAIAITSPANNLLIESGKPITIRAEASDPDGHVVSVSFFNGSTMIGEDFEAPYEVTISGLQSGDATIIAVATDDSGLTASAGINVTVVEPATAAFNIPRYFSPNGDGINDVWDWGDQDRARDAQVTVFNASGLKVFESQSYDNEWNGRYNGRPLDAGPYFYIVRLAGTVIKGAVRIVLN